jgi:isocitrate dehydrogenase (NAD+)
MRRTGGYSVTLIPGDGIGPEVTQAAIEVVAAAGVKITWDRQVAGAQAVEAGNDPIPQELIRSIRRNRVALKGPLATRVGRVGFRSVNVALRKTFGLYANVRPALVRALTA